MHVFRIKFNVPVCRQHGTTCPTVNQPATAVPTTQHASRARVCEGRVNLGSVSFQYGRQEIDKTSRLCDAIDLAVHPGRVEGS